MEQQNPGQPTQSSAPYGQPPAPGQQYAVASTAQPDIVKRGVAAFIDFAIIGVAVGILSTVLVFAPGGLGAMVAGVVGTAAMLARDVVLQGRSPGKMVMGLGVVNAQGGPITLQDSAMRNSTLAVGMLASAVSPIPLLGWLLAAVLGLAGFVLGVYELYLVATNQTRVGDKLAGTSVVFSGKPMVAI